MRNGLAFGLLVFVGCGASAEPPATPSPPAAAPPVVASASASPAEPPRAVAEPEPPRLDPIPPLTASEQTEFKSKCAAFGKAVEKAAASASGPPVFRAVDVFQEVASKPIPGLKDDARARCAELFERDLKGYVVDTLRVGAIGNLGVLAHLYEQALARGGKPCPSAPPVPRSFAALAKGVYTPTASDYEGPGWTCLENISIVDHLLAQIRVTTDPSANTVTLSARTMPLRDGKMIEYVRVGHVDGQSVKWDKAEARTNG